MDAVLENLFRIIPIVLAILWVLRRSTRRRRSAKKHEDRQTPVRPKGIGNSLFSSLQSIMKRSDGAAMPSLFQLEEKVPQKKAEETGSTAAKNTERRLPKSGPIKAPITYEASLTTSPQLPVKSDRAADTPTARGSLERLERLPPLPRALLWSFIVEKPPSLRGPQI